MTPWAVACQDPLSMGLPRQEYWSGVPLPSPALYAVSCIYTILEKTLESPLDSKEIKPVNPRGNNPEYSLEGLDAEAEAPILWPLGAKS